MFAGSRQLQYVTNHPVHLKEEEDLNLPPTALIPFCEFGGSMSAMGVKIDHLDSPVCTSFKAKIIRDQLCYQVDPNKFKDKIDIKGELSLSLFIHYNKDRQLEEIDNSNEHFITIETKGKEGISLPSL